MPAGQPPLFKDEESLKTAIEQYFGYCETTNKKITITGLAYYIGFESRQSFYDYEKHEEYSYIIKRARLRVESEYEQRLNDGKPVGAIFALKNMGWKDKQEIEQKTELSGTVTFSGIKMIRPDDPTEGVHS